MNPKAMSEAQRIEREITQRFISALRLWVSENEANRLGDYGTLKVDCADLIAQALQAEREAIKKDLCDACLHLLQEKTSSK